MASWLPAALLIAALLHIALVHAQPDDPSPPAQRQVVQLDPYSSKPYIGNITDGLPAAFGPPGQYGLHRVFALPVGSGGETDFNFSTCGDDTQFPTLLILLDSNPFETQVTPTVLAENRLDVECKNSRDALVAYSTGAQTTSPGVGALIEYRTSGLATETLYIVVSTWQFVPDNTDNSIATPIQPVPTPTNGSFMLSIGNSEGKLNDPEKPGWGLDRIDQRDTALNQKFDVNDEGEDVFIYVIDSGVRRGHVELKGRVTEGITFVHDGLGTEDCYGHGTHVAGLAAGSEFGVSRLARIIPVRVLNCLNKGSLEDVVQAADWVMDDYIEKDRKPAVALLSIGGNTNAAFAVVVQALVDAGITVVVAAGNENSDACLGRISIPGAIIVGSLDRDMDEKADRRSASTNFGACVDLYAPGASPDDPNPEQNGVLSAWATGDNAYRWKHGTSQAAPYVAGTVANLLAANPRLTPANVKEIITSVSTKNKIDNADDKDNNRILFVRNIPRIDLDPPPENFFFIYWIVTVQDQHDCNDSSLNDALRTGVTNTFTNRPYVEDIQFPICRPDFGTTPTVTPAAVQTDGPSFSNDLLAQKQAAEAPRATRLLVTYQLPVPVEMGRQVFTEVENAIEEQELKKSTVSVDILVEEENEPWVVDSRGFVYWAAPTFEAQKGPPKFSVGLVVAIVFASVTALVVVFMAAWGINRKLRPPAPSPFDGMYGSDGLNSRHVTFNDYQTAVTSPTKSESSRFRSSFRARAPRSPRGRNHMPGPLEDVNSTEEPSHLSPKALRITSRGGEAFASDLNGLGLSTDTVPSPPIMTPLATALPVDRDNEFATMLANGQAGESRRGGMQYLGGEAFAVSSGRDPIEAEALLSRTSSGRDTKGMPASEDSESILSPENSVDGSGRHKPRLQPSTIRVSSGHNMSAILMGDLTKDVSEIDKISVAAGEIDVTVGETCTTKTTTSKSPSKRRSKKRSKVGEEMLVTELGSKESGSLANESALLAEEKTPSSGLTKESVSSSSEIPRAAGNGGAVSSSIRRAGSNPIQSEQLFVPGEGTVTTRSSKRVSKGLGAVLTERNMSFASEGSETMISTGVTKF